MIGPVLSLLKDEVARVWCYRWTFVLTALVIFCAAAVYIAQIPSVYQSWAQIYVNKETPTAAAAGNNSLVGENYGSTYVVQKTMLNDQNLAKVVARLYPATAKKGGTVLQGAINNIRQRTDITPDDGDGFIAIQYRANNAIEARDVTQALLDQFIASNEGRNREGLDQAAKFLDEQVALYQQKLRDADQALAAFRQKHGVIAEASPQAGAASVDVARARANYDAVLRANGSSGPDASEIESLKGRLASLRLQYTDDYPDVVTVKHQLDQLLAARANAAAQNSSGAVQAARAQLLSAEGHMRSYQPKALDAASPLATEYAELKQNETTLRTSYQELLSRRNEAKISQAVYTGADAGKYQVTNRPAIPASPIGPNRSLYLTLAALVAAGLGLAAAYIRAALRGILVAPRELEEAFGLPVVGTISWEEAWHTTPGSAKPSRSWNLRSLSAMVVIGLVVLVAGASLLGIEPLHSAMTQLLHSFS
jgi:polysaccharide chain length determinant protein (PEP-CTERM system associated)